MPRTSRVQSLLLMAKCKLKRIKEESQADTFGQCTILMMTQLTFLRKTIEARSEEQPRSPGTK